MNASGTRQWPDRLLLVVAALMAVFVLSGCETMDQDNPDGLQSDMPWNEQQPWEAAPGIPGLSQ